jgi:tRNA U55 pseudouridine synthase TruB
VQGAFRQDDILNAWQCVLKKPGQWTTVQLDIQCGSGTYVRSLVHELGRRLACGAMLLDLRRTQVGEWNVSDPTVVRLSWPR